MKKFYLKIPVKTEPMYEDYYDTDKGNIYWLREEGWCTHDVRPQSPEYPTWWLRDAEEVANEVFTKEQMKLHEAYNATSTEHPEGSDQIESYQHWLEKQLFSRLKKDWITEEQLKVDNLAHFAEKYNAWLLEEAYADIDITSEFSWADARIFIKKYLGYDQA